MPETALRMNATALIERSRVWRDARRISKSGIFDRSWYLSHYPDVAAGDVDPVVHYLISGAREGRFPNPIFDGKWYERRYLRDPAINPLLHYLDSGAEAGNWPNRWFDPVWLRAAAGESAPKLLMPWYVALPANQSPVTCEGLNLSEPARRHPDLLGHRSPLGFYMHEYRVTASIGITTSNFISGWVSRKCDPAGIALGVLVNGVKVGHIVPDIVRPDVQAALGRPGYGFVFQFRPRLSHGDVVELRDEFGQILETYGAPDLESGCKTPYVVPSLGSSEDLYGNRAAIAASFLTGRGVEIGAFTQPTDLAPNLHVDFYDRLPLDVLRRHYDPSCHRPLMEPTIIGEAERLDGLGALSCDFLIANHVIEHLEDPVLFLEHVARVLKSGGRAMIAAPDKRFSFDRRRALTTFDHLVLDHVEGPSRSRQGHCLEWAVFVAGLEGRAALDWGQNSEAEEMSIHYHVWDADSFIAFTSAALERFSLPFELLYSRAAANEVIVVLEKHGKVASLSA